MDLQQLQSLAKRDPAAYKQDALARYRHFSSQLPVFLLTPNVFSKPFAESINFFSQVCSIYPIDLESYPQKLFDLLESSAAALHVDTRKAVVKALILMRTRGVVSPLSLLPMFFKLFRVHDKNLRDLLFAHIVKDIVRVNSKSKNNRLNSSLQNFMFTMLNDENHIAARKSLQVIIELYRKKIWTDSKTVNVISTTCFSSDSKILVEGLNFFLGSVEKGDDEKDAEAKKEAKATYEKYVNTKAKKTKKMKTKMAKALALVNKKARSEDDKKQPNFPAIQLLNDPHGFAEKLFGKLKQTTEKFEIRLKMMHLISRVIASHKVILLNFYPYLQKYIKPHQQFVTNIMAIGSESTHDLVPDDTILPLVMTIANNFVNDHSSAEAITVGLNTIREITLRCPLAMNEDLLQDIAKYKSYKNKGVAMASKSLIKLFRVLNPSLLNKKDRGKNSDISVKPLSYGMSKVHDNIPGIELLYEDPDNPDNYERFYDADGNFIGDDGASDEEGDEDEDEDGESDDEELEEIGDDEEEEAEDGEDEEELDEVEEDDKEDEDDEEEEMEVEEEAPKKPTPRMAEALRILTPEDFERIQYLRTVKQAELEAGVTAGNKKRKPEIAAGEYEEQMRDADGGYVAPEDLIEGIKGPKLTGAERLESIKKGREGREFGSKTKRKRMEKADGGKHTSLTHKQKARNQPLPLRVHRREIKQKRRSSMRDKQVAHHKHVETLRKQ